MENERLQNFVICDKGFQNKRHFWRNIKSKHLGPCSLLKMRRWTCYQRRFCSLVRCSPQKMAQAFDPQPHGQPFVNGYWKRLGPSGNGPWKQLHHWPSLRRTHWVEGPCFTERRRSERIEFTRWPLILGAYRRKKKPAACAACAVCLSLYSVTVGFISCVIPWISGADAFRVAFFEPEKMNFATFRGLRSRGVPRRQTRILTKVKTYLLRSPWSFSAKQKAHPSCVPTRTADFGTHVYVFSSKTSICAEQRERKRQVPQWHVVACPSVACMSTDVSWEATSRIFSHAQAAQALCGRCVAYGRCWEGFLHRQMRSHVCWLLRKALQFVAVKHWSTWKHVKTTRPYKTNPATHARKQKVSLVHCVFIDIWQVLWKSTIQSILTVTDWYQWSGHTRTLKFVETMCFFLNLSYSFNSIGTLSKDWLQQALKKNRRGWQTAISTGWQQRALTITRIQSWHCHGLLSTKIISCVMMCPVLVMPYVNALIDQLFEPWFHIELTVRLRDHNFPIVAHPNCRPNTSSRRVFGQVISGEVSSIAFLNVKYLTSARRHLYSIPARAASAWSHPFLNDFGPSSIGQHSFAPRQALWCLHPHPSAKEKMAKDVQRCCPSFQADWRCWWESGVGHCPMTKGIWELEQWSNVAGSTFFSLKLNTRFKLQNMSKLASHTPVAFATIQHHMCYAPEVLNVWYSPRHAY